jgi:glycosyltransferase involved in cell wall biosynthesis
VVPGAARAAEVLVRRGHPICRILLVSHRCYLDPSSESATAGRALLEALASRGHAAEVLCGTALELNDGVEIEEWLARQGIASHASEGESWALDTAGVHTDRAPQLRTIWAGVAATLLHWGSPTRPHAPDEAASRGVLSLFEASLTRSRPDVVLGLGDDPITRDVFARARARGVPTILLLDDPLSSDPSVVAEADAVLVASRFSQGYCREVFGFECAMMPKPVDLERARPEGHEPQYLVLIDPSLENGVFAFARIADELGRRRPDIPILVVEGRGTEATVAGCGIDLRARGNVFFMSHTPDARAYWRVARACLIPSLGRVEAPRAAVEAMANGIPVVASDRGGLPEALGESGIVLPLPDRITPATRMLPTAEEVAPWVEAVIRLWDDREFFENCRRTSRSVARRWAPEILAPMYEEFLDSQRTRPEAGPSLAVPPGRGKAVVLVPHLNGIEWECEESLRRLEEAGVRVVRRRGSSQIDIARNELASAALHDGFESILFVDADIGFDPLDALRLLARPEPVVAGIYAKKGERALAAAFADGVTEVAFGVEAIGPYPLQYAATGFLRIRAWVLRRMIEELRLPLCNTRWGRGSWPFFQPIVVPEGPGRAHYLGEDWAFSHRLAQIGVTPLADTSIRLWHWGRYAYGWEDAGAGTTRYRSYRYRHGDL